MKNQFKVIFINKVYIIEIIMDNLSYYTKFFQSKGWAVPDTPVQSQSKTKKSKIKNVPLITNIIIDGEEGDYKEGTRFMIPHRYVVHNTMGCPGMKAAAKRTGAFSEITINIPQNHEKVRNCEFCYPLNKKN